MDSLIVLDEAYCYLNLIWVEKRNKLLVSEEADLVIHLQSQLNLHDSICRYQNAVFF